MAGIVWLVSYPKSGNTWLRIFLANLLYPDQAPVDINNLPGMNLSGCDRRLFDELSGLESSDLDADTIDELRPDFYRLLAARSEQTLYVKLHDAYTLNRSGKPLFPSDVTQQVVYLLRNPLDIAVSWAHHRGVPIAQCVTDILDPTTEIHAHGRLMRLQLHQRLLDWSGHVKSWVDAPLPCHVMRYESMCKQPLSQFRSVSDALGLGFSKEAIEDALTHADFRSLQQTEERRGFLERAPHCERFFRSGRSGEGRCNLTTEQIASIEEDSQETMARFQYLSSSVVCVEL